MAVACSLSKLSYMNWYCIHTKPQKETVACEQLSGSLGLEVYFPCIQRLKQVQHARKQIVGPLFPRYLFCRFELISHYRAVRYARDVIDVVSFGAHPAVVSDDLVDDLKTWATQAPEAIGMHLTYSSGDQVRVSKGPMRGLEAIILEQSDDRDRVSVLLSILGCGARLRIGCEQLDRTSHSLTNCTAYPLHPTPAARNTSF